VVALGDSITDGKGSTDNQDERWTDILAQRVAPYGLAVINRGIGGNSVVAGGLGPTALSRFDRDVLGTPGVRYLILLEGVNDLGGLDRTKAHPIEDHTALVDALKSAYKEIARKAHDHGIQVFGGTVMPYTGAEFYHPSKLSEGDRQALNAWIRTSGTFDAVIDFDMALRDPEQPDRLATEAESVDHLHPGPGGYKRMGEVIPSTLFGATFK
jgi:lysophospholipase L1-like esterase